MTLTTGSLFSGMCSEFFALSSLAPTKQVFAADNDKFACRFIRQNVRPDILVTEDLTTFDVTALPVVDVFLAGVPCQSFSSLGRHQLDDPRRNLLDIPLKYAQAKRPKYFFFENVPRFRTSAAFSRLVEGLKRVYPFVEHAVLDASSFGSIQRRKRLFVVGSNVPVSLPCARGGHAPPLVSAILDPPSAYFRYLSDKGRAYLQRRARWGVKVYERGARAFMGTLPRSYGHQISWKHIIQEGNCQLRSLTPNEAFRIQSFDPSSLRLTGISRRQLMYLAGNAIDRRMLVALFASVIDRSDVLWGDLCLT
jgi:site-specific DNA-cytosine methylase